MATLLIGLTFAIVWQWLSSQQVTQSVNEIVTCTEQIIDTSPVQSSAKTGAMTQIQAYRERSQQQLNQANFILIGIGSLIIFLLMLSSWNFDQTIIKPMQTLRKGLDKIIQGELTHRISLRGCREMDYLGQSFNDMARELEDNTKRFYQTHADLLQTNQYLEAHRSNLEESNQRLHAEILIRKKTEQTLEAAVEHLNIANRDLEDFAFVTAHDIKTPLRGIGTLADLFKQDYRDRLDEQGLHLLDLLAKRTQRVHALVGGIMKYAKLAKEGTVIFRLVSTRDVVQQAIELVDPPDHIEVLIEGDLPDVVCDETRLLQVFKNLIENAATYMDKPHGLVRIKGELLDGYWAFSVADNGPGIPAEQQQKVFKLFQTLHRKDECATTGIGLSLVRKIVERYQGRVWVESEMGIGSTFFFSLKEQTLAPGQEELFVPVERRKGDRRCV